jgi:hypothetical protein
MTIVNVFPPDNHINELNNELCKNFVNDELFRSNFFKIYIKDPDPLDILYRRLYEERYLNFKEYDMSKFNYGLNCFILNITINEVIYFINKVTPPIIKLKYDNKITDSIETMLDLLKHFLVEETGQLKYHISELQKSTGFNYFETSSSYDMNRNKLLRKFNPSGAVIDIMVCDCFAELYKEDPSLDERWINIHLMINCFTKKEIQSIIDIIMKRDDYNTDLRNKIYVLNVFKTEFEGFFVDMYIQNYYYKSIPEIHNLMLASYKNIM